MWKVGIHVESNTIRQSSCSRMYGYVLECTKNGAPFYAEGEGNLKATYHAAILTGIIKALERLKTNCEVCIYSRDEYVISRIKELKQMEDNNFLTKAGKPQKNAELWEQLAKLCHAHVIKAEVGPSAHTMHILKRIDT